MTNNVVISWLGWHFYEMPTILLQSWKNFMQFSINYFSTPLLLKTLFSPWRRYNWGYPRGFDVKMYLETFISNVFSRIMGAICRTVLIIIGVVFQIFVVLAGGIIILLWVFLPLFCVAALLFSFSLI